MSIEVTWLGHACWMLRTTKYRILIDPFLTNNPSAKVQPEELETDFILVTHGHFDHVDDAAKIAARTKAQLIANFEVAEWFRTKHGVSDPIGMNLGGSLKLPFGRLKMTIAWHSSQLPDGSYGGNACGYLIESEGKRIYFAGDTALFSDMKLIGEAGIDLAVLPIGDLYTMGPDDSLRAVEWIKPKVVMPSHYNTWPAIAQNATEWAATVRWQCACEALVPAVGEVISL